MDDTFVFDDREEPDGRSHCTYGQQSKRIGDLRRCRTLQLEFRWYEMAIRWRIGRNRLCPAFSRRCCKGFRSHAGPLNVEMQGESSKKVACMRWSVRFRRNWSQASAHSNFNWSKVAGKDAKPFSCSTLVLVRALDTDPCSRAPNEAYLSTEIDQWPETWISNIKDFWDEQARSDPARPVQLDEHAVRLRRVGFLYIT